MTRALNERDARRLATMARAKDERYPWMTDDERAKALADPEDCYCGGGGQFGHASQCPAVPE